MQQIEYMPDNKNADVARDDQKAQENLLLQAKNSGKNKYRSDKN